MLQKHCIGQHMVFFSDADHEMLKETWSFPVFGFVVIDATDHQKRIKALPFPVFWSCAININGAAQA